MAGNRISRNDPCPCGSGKKFKHCCISKGIDWDARKAAPARGILSPAPRPKPVPPPDFAFLGPFARVDARLKEMARSSPGQAPWKDLVERLSPDTPAQERMEAYRSVRMAGVLPDDAAGFPFGHAIQWLPFDSRSSDDQGEPVDGLEALQRQTPAVLRRHGADDLAGLFENDRLEYDRRYERGRQFFLGPPDELLAARLREMGIID